MAALQDLFLYFPERLPPERYRAEALALRLAPWPSSDDFRALLREPDTPARATAVIFHGNAGHALHRAWYASVLSDLGLRVLLAEYPGYGHRSGALGEASFAGDGARLLALARQRFPGPLVVIGESLGAGVAGSVVVREPVDAVLLITPWKDLSGLAGHHYPWLPTRWLLRDRYDTAANLASFRGPVAVIVAERDEVIPQAFGRALFDALPDGRKHLLVVPGRGHNDWQGALDTAAWRQLVDFLLCTDRD